MDIVISRLNQIQFFKISSAGFDRFLLTHNKRNVSSLPYIQLVLMTFCPVKKQQIKHRRRIEAVLFELMDPQKPNRKEKLFNFKPSNQ